MSGRRVNRDIWTVPEPPKPWLTIRPVFTVVLQPLTHTFTARPLRSWSPAGRRAGGGVDRGPPGAPSHAVPFCWGPGRQADALQGSGCGCTELGDSGKGQRFLSLSTESAFDYLHVPAFRPLAGWARTSVRRNGSDEAIPSSQRGLAQRQPAPGGLPGLTKAWPQTGSSALPIGPSPLGPARGFRWAS